LEELKAAEGIQETEGIEEKNTNTSERIQELNQAAECVFSFCSGNTMK